MRCEFVDVKASALAICNSFIVLLAMTPLCSTIQGKDSHQTNATVQPLDPTYGVILAKMEVHLKVTHCW